MAGVRSSKTDGTTEYKFDTLSGLVMRQTWDGKSLYFLYQEVQIMKKYQFLCALSPSEIKSLFVDAYDTSKPLLLLLYDWLGINKGTFCRISEDRFWLFRTVPLDFFPKRHFSGILSYHESQLKTMITGRFVYSPWYFLYLLIVFLFLLFSMRFADYFSIFEALIVSFLMTCLFGLFAVLLSNVNRKPRENEIIQEMESFLEEAQNNHLNNQHDCHDIKFSVP